MDIKVVSYKEENQENLQKMMFDFQKFMIHIDTWKVFKFDKDYRDKATDELLKNIKEKKGKVYLAKSGNDFIGYIAGYIVPNKKDFETYTWKRGYVDELYLEEKYRRLGIGKKLLGKIEDYFRSQKCDTIGFNALFANKNALEFYGKLGFEKRSLFLSKALNKKVKK